MRRHRPDSPLVETPMPQGDPLGACATITRMKDVLAWEPSVSIEDGVQRYMEWVERTPGAIPEWLRAECP